MAANATTRKHDGWTYGVSNRGLQPTTLPKQTQRTNPHVVTISHHPDEPFFRAICRQPNAPHTMLSNPRTNHEPACYGGQFRSTKTQFGNPARLTLHSSRPTHRSLLRQPQMTTILCGLAANAQTPKHYSNPNLSLHSSPGSRSKKAGREIATICGLTMTRRKP